MSAQQIRERFLTFFEKRGHAILPSASLVPENDPSVLFNTAGMQPLVPYLLGEKHPQGKRLANAQKCVRTVDIDEIGDNTHATFFEMLGNWSLGDYFKEEAIRWSYEFLTSKEEGLGLDPRRLYVTVFEGDENAPRDEEAYAIWKKIFEEHTIAGERIYFLGAKSNWWSAGDNGPCGPDTEMFYDVTGTLTEGLSKEAYLAADDRQDVVEIWNDVFMEFEKKDGRVVGKLANKNVDTGSGLERVAMVVQGKNNIFDTDIFASIFARMDSMGYIPQFVGTPELVRARRIIADHTRTAVFMVSDGIVPSNKDQGYILRRLIRRGVRLADKYFLSGGMSFTPLTFAVTDCYESAYPDLQEKREHIHKIIVEEAVKFGKALHKGNKEAEARLKNGTLTGKDAFELFTTYGFPLEMTQEIAIENGVDVNIVEFEKEFKNHQDLSRAGSAGKFKGGLADHGEMSVKYHTTTHLLQQALRQVLGDHVAQKGSNITAERLRFDFSHPSKMTEEEIKRTESIVNEKIKEALPVSYQDIPLEEAKKLGAIGLFGEKYGETVRVYKVGDFSLEFCGGPHVTNTSELGTFKITKEEASSAGVRRIKAVLE
ncbi:MAG: alanine--tRNA ligase [Candidatus Moranbacteria bacterium]|nr:alanine--tRNA ligase [Candidatus Moranbacteria bacterium]